VGSNPAGRAKFHRQVKGLHVDAATPRLYRQFLFVAFATNQTLAHPIDWVSHLLRIEAKLLLPSRVHVL
jgi:hypothetical protein